MLAVHDRDVRPLVPWLLSLVALVACQIAPRLPPTSAPSVRGNTVSVGVGITTRFRATLTEDGQTRDVVPLPTQTLAVLEIPTIGLHHGLNGHCDAGGQLGVGQLAGEARCGVGSNEATAAIATSVQYLWWSGLVGRAELQVGLAKAGWLMFASTGISFGWLRYKIPLGDYEPWYLAGPPDPAVVIREREVSWASSVAVGVPLATHGSEPIPSAFLGFTFDRPVTTSTPTFTCEGCMEAHSFEGFTPGWQLGVIVGMTGKL